MSKITIHGIEQRFINAPEIEVSRNGYTLARVKTKEDVQIEVDVPCELSFKVNGKVKTCLVTEDITNTFVFFNRLTGGLSIITCNEGDLEQTRRRYISKINKNNLFTGVFFVFLFLLWFGYGGGKFLGALGYISEDIVPGGRNSAVTRVIYRMSAELGCEEAMFNLGLCYEHCDEEKVNLEEAAKWYMRAAEKGRPNAQYNIAYCYEHGNGVEKNYTEALKWYKQSAENGDNDAYHKLGRFYEEGWGTKANFDLARKYYQMALDKGNIYSPYCLAQMAQNGKGEPVDFDKALRYYNIAYNRGNLWAQNEVAYMYAKGMLGEKNPSKAIGIIEKLIDEAKTNEEKQNFIDSKGEFLLMQHKESEARALWKGIVAIDKEYAESNLLGESEYGKFIKTGVNPYSSPVE